MKIVFATNNFHKLTEVRNAIPSSYEVSGLDENGIHEDIPETKDTLQENAIEKASYIYTKYHLNCFADDTGLEVRSLDNRPGVYSARYAGLHCSFDDNVNKLLNEMKGITDRTARFRTVIAFVDNGNVQTFEGIVEGTITLVRRGNQGFGYDPVFQPLETGKTFAEMSLGEKNKISHRARALQKFVKYLSSFTP